MGVTEKLQYLPARPGVYLFRDMAGEIIYVGKAVSLKNRVRSYFQSGANLTPKVRAMVPKIADLEYIVTDSEVEALILESNLIKEHRPRYNVSLKDDKSYPYLKVTLNEDFPRVFITRRVLKDGARYFGPYTRVGAVHETMRLLKKLFPFRTCKQKEPPNRDRPCLNQHIKRCLGPCCGLVSKEEYKKAIDEICLFLEGRQDELVKSLKKRMEEAAEALEFERAAELRDQLQAVETIVEKQKIISSGREDQDVVALARGISETCVMVFFIRGGKIIGREHFLLRGTEDSGRAEVITAFIKQYYNQAEFIPREILLPEIVEEEAGVISQWLSEKKEARVYLRVPRRGEKRRLVEMVEKNALLLLDQIEQERQARKDDLQAALGELARALGLKKPPYRLECYDISNTQGTESVASMVVFEEGKPRKDQYRKFKIKTVEGPNDFASMQEVIERRFKRGKEERELINTGQLSTKDAKFHRLPDLVIIDGGKGQLSAAREVMHGLGFSYIPTFGLAKQEELLFKEGEKDPVVLPRDSRALYLVQRLRDEAHRFAITYHRQLRTKRNLKSLLDEIEGIGPKRRRELLKAFSGLEEIGKAGLDELAAVEGMNKKAAEAVYEYFHKKESGN
ncbi:excinuclease ABC subunit UvrC [Desulfolucanica intricata]|uniref:excinuclease ABC subunit UvrC n=1 Tax=Desulfolucanica intricata TaxID=1285191 RepID=UPI00082FCB30|nr:excinuclease ABC subunit UvrC [Desulfolucanica intricata]